MGGALADRRTLQRVAAAVLALGLGAAPAAGSRAPEKASVLYAGVTGPGVRGVTHVIGDAEAVRDARSAERGWLVAIRGRRTGDLGHVFHCAAPSGFRSGLRRAAVTYGFTVRTVSCPEKGRFAPSIVAESNDYVRLAHALGSIRLALDPLSNDGFAYPCFVEAVDSRGIPYAAAFDVGRAGGQWARADALYPFAHG